MAATENILAEMKEQVTFFKSEDKLLEAQRIHRKDHFDVEDDRETGFCSGIENYSLPLTFGNRGNRPARFWTTSRRVSLLSLTSPILRFPR